MGWFVFGASVIFLLLSFGGYYGYRRDWYGSSSATGIVLFLFVIFWIVVVIAGLQGAEGGW